MRCVLLILNFAYGNLNVLNIIYIEIIFRFKFHLLIKKDFVISSIGLQRRSQSLLAVLGGWFSFETSWSIRNVLLSITEFMVILLSAIFPCITISVSVEIWDSVQLKGHLNFWHHCDILLKSGNSLLSELFINLKKDGFVFHA